MAQHKGEIIGVGQMATPLGDIRLAFDGDAALMALEWSVDRGRLEQLLGKQWPGAVFEEQTVPEALRAALDDYFAGDVAALNRIAVRTNGTDFRERVWAALRAIPTGETRSYGQIAVAVGSPKAVRAVGQANRYNPVGLVNPCHRVIATGGGLGGYEWGHERKTWLLAHEGVKSPD
ncbi:methylated-DNA--[protein]-cysteine S-methyltransferase [Brevundimonas terrae]|uniref:Methylated-DNA--[protein]-cysteine S-methyltransferase n=1 Tax=Brevundimonas terrae TaxID=363631 RepID=A0ABN0Y6M8_9CAUL|nr:methylated-DNA--[protein]-cysteine S-methyltransferase [Brevundimonas terrae]NIJ25513.1 methylated-DNA-[protein]-cysteine S-methyltransferase [Brevundimonas terrae]